MLGIWGGNLEAEDVLRKQKANDLANIFRVNAINSNTVGVEPDSSRRIVVSLTTFSKRIDDVYLCIESLLQQSLRPNRIVLWLSDEEFSAKELPAMLLRQQARGLEIRFCPRDIGAYKKIIPSLVEFPDHLIITVDDDVMYPVDMVDKLYRSYLSNPGVVHAARAHFLRFDSKGELLPYKQWKTWPEGESAGRARLEVVPTGVGGVLYFPGCFDDEVLNEEAFMRLAPAADDIWLKAMCLRKGTLSQKVDDHRVFGRRYLFIEGSQAFALKRKNKSKVDGNDLKVKAVFKEYGLYSLFAEAGARAR